jgi:hypothetical protein
VLNQWLLSLFNVKGFEDLAEHLRTESLEGLDENNVHHFHHALTAQLFNLTQLPTELLLEYDQNIVKQGPVSFKFIISIFENSGLPDFSRRTLRSLLRKGLYKISTTNPLPLPERARVRDNKKKCNEIQSFFIPTLPHRGGGVKREPPDGKRVLFLWFRVSRRKMNYCGGPIIFCI